MARDKQRENGNAGLISEWVGYLAEALMGGLLMPVTNRLEALLDDIDDRLEEFENRLISKFAMAILLAIAAGFFALALYFLMTETLRLQRPIALLVGAAFVVIVAVLVRFLGYARTKKKR